MKILFLTPWYPDEINPNHGIFVRDQAVAISRHHEVRVISSKIDYSSFALSRLQRTDQVFRNLKESRIVIKRSLPVFNQLNYFLRTTLETYKISQTFKPDIIHGNIGYPGAFWSWMMSRLLRIPFVITEHTRITNHFRSFIHKKITLFGLRRAARIIAVSERHADEILRFVGEKPLVIHNVINFEKFSKVLGLPETGEFQIGFLGGLNTPVKGLDLLLRAAATLRGKFRLHIGGKGNLLEYYKTLAGELRILDKCVFYGAIAHEEVNSLMERLHFFVSASRYETFGIAMVEALACGLPVVATDSGGSREFITDENGILVNIDPQSLADGISELMRNFHRYDPIAIRNSVVSKFLDDNFLRKIDQVYNEVFNT
jgi:glycosyltransferase involved in cell wall biosynthesis